jgi:DNA-binding transcriptional LysR family regulator
MMSSGVRREAGPEDFMRHVCVGAAPPLPFHATWRVGLVPVAVNPSIIANATESARAAAIAGLGLVPAPDGSRRCAGRRPAYAFLAGFETPSSGIYAVYPANRLMTPVIREFVRHVIGESRSRGVPI